MIDDTKEMNKNVINTTINVNERGKIKRFPKSMSVTVLDTRNGSVYSYVILGINNSPLSPLSLFGSIYAYVTGFQSSTASNGKKPK